MKKRIFGFDLGIASIGWAVVDFDNEKFDLDTGEIIEGEIVKSGVRIFPIAENPKDGTSLAAPRREFRLARRTIRRKSRRMDGIKKLFIALGLAPSEDYLKKLYATQVGGDVWDLRVKALSQKLEKDELLRVLTHLAKHRGFKSYRKAEEEKDAEGGKVLKAIKENKELLEGNKTLAQVIVEKSVDRRKKRNRIDKSKIVKEPIYINSIPREEIIKELDVIFNFQKQFGLFNEKLFQDFKKIAFRHRPVGSIGDMVGFCTFENSEKRAPKEAPSSELFVALGKINNLKVNGRFLTTEERTRVLELLKNNKEVKYTTLRKAFDKGADIRFDDIDYKKTTKKDKKTGEIKEINPEDIKFYSMKGWHTLKSAFGNQWDEVKNNVEMLDKAVEVVATYKNDEEILKNLKDENIQESYVDIFSKLTFKEFVNLSLKALYKINPHLEDGLKYNDACEKAGYDFKDTGEKLVEKGLNLAAIPNEKMTNSPVVNRTVSQFRKVYNEMVRKFGLPDQINLECGRELKKSFDERKKISKKRDENAEERQEAAEQIKSYGQDVNYKNILKYRLYEQQDGKCIYSGASIDLHNIENYDVDHILPYSRSLDDSFNNKVLCLASENRQKSNKTPYEYLAPKGKWDDFVTKVRTSYSLGKKRRDNLLNESFSKDENELEFRERNKNDNSYIATFVKKYLEDGVDFSHSMWKDIKNRVQVRNGALTDYLRHQWGLSKDRNENDKHHAQDAIVVACATQGMVQCLSRASALLENKKEAVNEKGEAWYKSFKPNKLEPWHGFRLDVLKSLEDIFVSRPPRKKATGAIHKETIMPKNKEKGSLEIRNGMAEKDNMFRYDIFTKDGKYFVVPIYIADLKQKDRKDIYYPIEYDEKANKKYVDDTYNFEMTLYKDDYVEIINKAGEIFKGYINQYNAQSGQFYIGMSDNSNAYSINTKTFEINDVLTLPIDGDKKEICKVSGYDVNNSKLILASTKQNNATYTIDAKAKMDKKGEVSKSIETDIFYEKLDKEKKLSISTFVSLKKYYVGVLGDLAEVKKEKRTPVNTSNKSKKKG